MKKVLKSMFAVVLSLTLVTGCASKANKTIATVYGEDITYSRYIKELTLFKAQIQMQFGDAIWSQTFPGSDATFLEHLKSQILDNLIVNTILKQEAEKKGITIDEEEYAKAVQNTTKSLNEDEKMKQYNIDNGIDEKYIKQMVKESMLGEAYYQDFIKNNQATEEEINKYYQENKATKFTKEQVKASHILIKTQDQDDKDLPQEQQDQAKAQIDDIYNRLMAGENFEELARQYSQDSSKDAGGDLGYFGKGMMVPEFENKAFSMNVGEISEPVKSQFGYHIIKLTDKIVEETSLDQAKEAIKASIEEEKFYNNITKLKDDKEKVTKNEDLLKDAEKDIKEDALKAEKQEQTDKMQTTKPSDQGQENAEEAQSEGQQEEQTQQPDELEAQPKPEQPQAQPAQ